MNYLINTTKDPEVKKYLIHHELEQIRQSVVRQAMFADFERITHNIIDNGDPLSADTLCSIYHNLQVDYYGNDIIKDKGIDFEWARVPHFYTNFYVYQYTTGYAAATMFADKILKNEDGALENYMNFLSSGGNDYSLQIQQKCGVDMTQDTPMKAVLSRFKELLDMLEELI